MCGKLLSREFFYSLFRDFIDQANSGDLTTKKYRQTIADFEVRTSFGKGRAARVPWLAFFSNGQTPQCGICPACLYYKEHDLLIVVYSVSQETPPSLSWGEIVKNKISVDQCLRLFGVDDFYRCHTQRGIGTLYGDSSVESVFPSISKIVGIDDEGFGRLFSSFNRVLDCYRNVTASKLKST